MQKVFNQRFFVKATLIFFLSLFHVGTVYPIGLSFGTSVADYDIKVQENFHNLFTLGIIGAQSWSKSGYFMIFSIFNQLYIFVLRKTFSC